MLVSGNMLSSLTSFLFNGNVVPRPDGESVDYRTKDAEDDWLLVDFEENHKPPQEREKSDKPRSSGKPLSAINVNLLVPQEVVPPASPSQMDGSWYVTPPPCFIVEEPVFVETSPLENLLIEHPSMSVYGSRPAQKRKPKLHFPAGSQPPSKEVVVDENTDISKAVVVIVPTRQLSPVLEQAETRRKASTHGLQQNRKGHIHSTPSIATKSGLVEETRQLLEIQKQQHFGNQCKIKRSSTDRHNRTKLFQSSCKRPRRRNKLSLGNSYANNNRKCC